MIKFFKKMNVFYLIKEGFVNVWKNKIMSLASIGVLLSCLIILGTFLLLIMNINVVIKDIAGMNKIDVFILDSKSDTDLSTIKNEMIAIDHIKNVEFVSKEENLEKFKEMNKDTPNIYEGLEGDNPLRNSFTIELSEEALINVELNKETVERIKAIDGVDRIRFNLSVVSFFEMLNGILSAASLWFVGILFLISIFIISNTIKLTLHARKIEINIMKYVGATNWFIRIPFILEGIILGLVSGIIASIFQWYIYDNVAVNLISKFNENFNIIQYSTVKNYIVLIFLSTGVLVGIFGTVLSIRKYLKV